MTDIDFQQEAFDALDALYDSHPELYDAIDAVLEDIERDPSAAATRKRLIRPGRVFGIRVRDPRGPEDYMVLWSLEDGVPTVLHIGLNVLDLG